MNLLLTGASGFVGKNFIKSFSGKYHISAIVRDTSDTKDIEGLCEIYRYDGDIIKLKDYLNAFLQNYGGGGDLASKEKIKPFSVNKAHNANRCDSSKATCDSNADNTADSNANFGILHLATKYIPSHTPEDISSLIDSNIAFGSEILEATMDFKPRFFVNILTFSQFANSHAYNPASFYDATKQAFYEIIELYKNAFKETKFLHILLYNTYGSNDTRDKILNLWDKISQNGKDLAMSAGEQRIDISHIDDVVRGLDMAIKNAENLDSNKIYTLENFPRYTLKDIAKIFETATKRELKIAWGAKPYRKNEIFSPISSVDSPKFVKLPHYEAKISLESGIKQVFLHKNKAR